VRLLFAVAGGFAMPRRRLLLGAGALALLGLAAWTWLLVPPDPISPEGAARIREGMTIEEVEGVLGGGKAFLEYPSGLLHSTAVWEGDGGLVTVYFVGRDSESRVSGTAEFTRREPRRFLDRLRRLLPW
jgi:hypothetical protein